MEEQNNTPHESTEDTGSDPEDRTPFSSPSPVTPKSVLDDIKGFILKRYPFILAGVIIIAGLLPVIAPQDMKIPPAPVVNATPEDSVPRAATSPSAKTTPPAETPLPSSDLRLPASGNRTLYEEYAGDDLEEMVKQADFALYEAMKAGDVGPDRLDLRNVEVKRYNGRDFHYQAIAIHPDNAEKFMSDFKAGLSKRVPDSVVVRTGQNDYILSLAGQATHELHISAPEPGPDGTPAPPRPYEPPKQLVPGPKIAIVIDDLGESVSFAQSLAELPFPIAFSVWPYSSNRKTAARIGAESGNTVLLHQPMQPRGWPNVRPGRGAVYTNMTRDDIQAVIRRNIVRIPGAQGVNNHMGSKFTEWHAGMNAALDAIHSKGLFFLDSRTTSKSAARAEAKKVGIPLYRRNIFLDNVAQVDPIIHQLRKTERIALTRGTAIAIGHPHAATLAALKKWADIRDTRVSVVPLTSLAPE